MGIAHYHLFKRVDEVDLLYSPLLLPQKAPSRSYLRECNGGGDEGGTSAWRGEGLVIE